jgi:hypothetical protein
MSELSNVEDALFQLGKRLYHALETPASDERAATVASIEEHLRELDGSSGAVVAELMSIAQSLVNLAGRSQAFSTFEQRVEAECINEAQWLAQHPNTSLAAVMKKCPPRTYTRKTRAEGVPRLPHASFMTLDKLQACKHPGFSFTDQLARDTIVLAYTPGAAAWLPYRLYSAVVFGGQIQRQNRKRVQSAGGKTSAVAGGGGEAGKKRKPKQDQSSESRWRWTLWRSRGDSVQFETVTDDRHLAIKIP